MTGLTSVGLASHTGVLAASTIKAPSIEYSQLAPMLVVFGAALIGVGLVPWVEFLASLQQLVWPRQPDESEKMIVAALIVVPVVFNLAVAGVWSNAAVAEFSGCGAVIGDEFLAEFTPHF